MILTNHHRHNMLKPLIWISLLLLMVITLSACHEESDITSETMQPDIQKGIKKSINVKIPVYMHQLQEIHEVPLEQYVTGVLFAEMPMSFHIEALKAQAIASRTYVIHQWLQQSHSHNPSHFYITDTTRHQVYLDTTKIKATFSPSQAKDYQEKILRAVTETKGQIMVYNHQPIQAAYFSTSNGYTENAEDYWQQPLPYLRSVDSPWDKHHSPRYQNVYTFTHQDFLDKLGMTPSSNKGKTNIEMKVIERTRSHRIKLLQVNEKRFSGKEVREKLGISSTDFTWKQTAHHIEITSYGNGHGVGMSQYGANAMAKMGKNAIEIIQHYYAGVRVEEASSYIKPKSSYENQ